MEFRTCFSSICESGYKIDAIKSGMQKYLRRREPAKMKWCANELYKFHFGENENEKQIGKGIFSNLINRIIVMLDEELCFDEVTRYLAIYEWIEELRKEEDYEAGLAILYRICDALCCGNLIRLSSDICGFYNKRIFMDKVEVKVEEMMSMEEVNIHSLVKKGESEDFELCLRNFVGHFNQKNTNAYYWLFRIFHMENEGVKSRYRRKEYIYGVWEFLEGLIGENEKLRKCWENRIKEFYNKSKNERKMFLVAVVNVFMYRDEIDFEKEITFCESAVIHEKKMVLDDYCIDMHCSSGRNSGKNRKDFAMEGCLVVDEYVKYKVEEWRAYYISEKLKDVAIYKKAKVVKFVASVKEKVVKEVKEKVVKEVKKKVVKEIKEKAVKSKIQEKKALKSKMEALNQKLDFIPMDSFEFIRLCSNTTCGNKVMCFIVKYNEKLYVLKEGRDTMNYNYDYDMIDKCKDVFGLKSIEMVRIRSDKKIEKIDKSQKFWENNFHFVEKKDVVYSMMNFIEGIKFIDYRRSIGEDNVSEELWIEYMKIGLFRGIFLVSDFSQINILLDKDKNSYSIDEHDVLGKRDYMVGEKNMKVYKKYYYKVDNIMSDLYANQEEKIDVIRNVMGRYLIDEEKINEVISNYKNLRERFSKEYLDM